MLFDLQGKRRRVVQVVYLTLAILLGGGLVFFGIGSDVQGGLSDIFSSNGGGGGNNVVDDRIEENEKKIKKDPADAQALKELTQDYYSKAASLPVGEDGAVPQSGQGELRKADGYYQSYLELNPDEPDASLARVAYQLYGPTALNKAKELEAAARLLAEEENDSASYLLLVDAATRSGNTRAADLAGTKVVELAPKGQKKQAKKTVEQTKAQAQAPPASAEGAEDPSTPAPALTP